MEFQKGDLAAAPKSAPLLERLWDKAEEYGGDTARAKTNLQLFDESIEPWISSLPLYRSKGQISPIPPG